MKKIFIVIFTVAMGIGLAFGEVPSVNAQNSEEEYTLQEITVTAEKREREIQKVAATVDVVEGSTLTEMGMRDLQQALKYQAEVLAQPAAENLNISIRGMDNDSMPGEAFSQVAVVIDGSFSDNFGMGNNGIFDMDRIEVLAGPQGTLYARNSSGGVVNMVSKVPKVEDFDALGSVEIGTKRLRNYQGMVNTPLNEKLAVRAAFISTLRDGYAPNGMGDANNRSMRFRLGYYPSDDLTAVLTYEGTRVQGTSMGSGYIPFEEEGKVANPWSNTDNIHCYSVDNRTEKYYLNFTWNTPLLEIAFTPFYTKTIMRSQQGMWLTEGGIGFFASGAKIMQVASQWFTLQVQKSAELRFSSTKDSFMEWMVGLYWFDRDWNDRMWHDAIYGPNNFYSPSTEPLPGVWSQITQNPSSAAYGNLKYPVSDRFRVALGLRYSADKENYARANVWSHYKSKHTDYKLGVEYDLNNTSMLWAEYATGYKQALRGLAPQTLGSYQAGYKSRHFNNKLQFNITGFYYAYKNFAISISNPKPLVNDLGETVTYNASGTGDANIYGFDTSTDWIISQKDRLNLSLSYLNAAVDQVLVIWRYLGQESPLIPRAYVDAGKPLNNAPGISIVPSYEHRFDLSDGGAITSRISSRFTSRYYLSFYVDNRNIPAGMNGNKVNTEPKSHMTDVNVNYMAASGKWNINAYLKNIENHAQKTSMMGGFLYLAPPRTWGLVMTVNY